MRALNSLIIVQSLLWMPPSAPLLMQPRQSLMATSRHSWINRDHPSTSTLSILEEACHHGFYAINGRRNCNGAYEYHHKSSIQSSITQLHLSQSSSSAESSPKKSVKRKTSPKTCQQTERFSNVRFYKTDSKMDPNKRPCGSIFL